MQHTLKLHISNFAECSATKNWPFDETPERRQISVGWVNRVSYFLLVNVNEVKKHFHDGLSINQTVASIDSNVVCETNRETMESGLDRRTIAAATAQLGVSTTANTPVSAKLAAPTQHQHRIVSQQCDAGVQVAADHQPIVRAIMWMNTCLRHVSIMPENHCRRLPSNLYRERGGLHNKLKARRTRAVRVISFAVRCAPNGNPYIINLLSEPRWGKVE